VDPDPLVGSGVPSPWISNVYARAFESLSGDWRYLVDSFDRGEGMRIGEDRRRSEPGELIEFAFENAGVLRVPGDWNTQDERLFFYEGAVWYQREINVVPAPGRRYFLWFGAVNYRAKVWVGGRPVGEHAGGYTPFCCEISDLAAGRASLVVKVDARHTDRDVPTRSTDWLHYGGITRDVLLVDLPETFIADYGVQLARGEKDRIRGHVQLDGPALEQDVRVSVPELGCEARVRSGPDGRAEFSIDAEPELWSPERPRLYGVVVECESDRVSDEIGFRTIETRGADILLNGEPVFLRGISAHEESLLHPGRASGPEDAEATFGLVRELGANFVRLAHYPHDEHMARAADRLGLLVWAEIPLYWGIAWEDADTLELAKQQMRELVSRDRNRASVVLWSLSNETPPTSERTAFLGELAAYTRELDDTRLLTSALFGNAGEQMRQVKALGEARARGESLEPGVLVLDDPIAEHIDVVGWNQYLGWYYSAFVRVRNPELSEGVIRAAVLEAMPSMRVEVASGKPLVVSEFGAGAKQGLHGGEDEVWTEEYQARVYRAQLAMLENAPCWRGLSPWILKDFRTPIRMLPGVQDGWNRKGLVSETGARKLAFDVLRGYYEKRRGS
jgi:beta-glucuronidase